MAKSKNTTTTTNKGAGNKQLMRLLDNLRKNAEAGDINAIVVSVDLGPDAVYPHNGKPDADAGGYTAAVDIARTPKDDDGMVGVACTATTRGLAVSIQQKLIQRPGPFG